MTSPVRLLPVLDQRRGRLGGQLPQGLHRPHAARRSRSWSGRWREEPFRRAAQRALAADVTTLVHGAAATAAVQAASEALFGKGDLDALDARHARGRHRRAARAPTSASGRRSSTPSWPCGLVDSRNAARRAIGEGGASVNNVKVSDPEAAAGRRRLPARGRWRCSRRGRKSSPRRGARPEHAGVGGTGRPGGHRRRPLARPGVRLRRQTASRPLTSGFVISVRRADLLFSSSARQGGTDTTGGARASLDVGRSRGWHHDGSEPAPTGIRQGFGAAANSLPEWIAGSPEASAASATPSGCGG